MATNLHETLQSKGVEHIIIGGPLANITLDSTVRDGVEQGYHVTLLHDCASAASPDELEATLHVTLQRYAQTHMDLAAFKTLVG